MARKLQLCWHPCHRSCFGCCDRAKDVPLQPYSPVTYLDTGPNMSMVQKGDLDTDRDFFGPSAKVMRIKTSPVELADGDYHADVHEIVKDVVHFLDMRSMTWTCL